MRIDIIVTYIPRYRFGHEANFVPPITGIHLAALTPPEHVVRVFHQQVDALPTPGEADLVAISFFSGFAPAAYRLAQYYRTHGSRVVMGGPHATFWPEEALRFCDSVVTGEAESVWPGLIADAARSRLQRVYAGVGQPLDGLPTPRYDLLADAFIVRRVVQATRGCPYSCSFCSVPSVNPGFRVRPVAQVLRDIAYDEFPFWWQRKVVWFWDDNLLAHRAFVKELLRAMIPLRRWWLTQCSLDVSRDPELLTLMRESGCIGVFFGIESFGPDSLRDANKRQNHVDHYATAIKAMHTHGIAVMAGFVAGFDHDTPEAIVSMADHLQGIGVDVPFLSVLTPYKGTPLFEQLQGAGRLLRDRGWEYYNGYNVAFAPRLMSPGELLAAHRELWRRAFSPANVAARVARAGRSLRTGAALLSSAMNAFYGLKRLRGNEPLNIADDPIAGPTVAPALPREEAPVSPA